jgi:hypothetical protein
MSESNPPQVHINRDSFGTSVQNQGEIHNTFNFYRSPSGALIPMQYPPRAKNFVGRADEIRYILDTLDSGAIVTITGPGGIGKSAVVAEAVHQLAPENELAPEYPDGILFHNFYNQSEVAIAYDHIVRSYGEEPVPTPEAAARRVLSARKPLIILDGAEAADRLPDLLDICRHCDVIVTSRRHEDADDAYKDLPTLPPADAVPLLKKWAGAFVDNDEAAQQICVIVDRLPLAVRLIGRYLRQYQQPASLYLQWLQATPLQALDQGQKRLQSVPYLIDHSL